MSYQFTFETDLLRGPQEREIEVTVTYIVTDRVPATYWQPAEGGEVELDDEQPEPGSNEWLMRSPQFHPGDLA